MGAASVTLTINYLQLITVCAVKPGHAGDNLEAERSREAETRSAFQMRQLYIFWSSCFIPLAKSSLCLAIPDV